LPEKEIVITTSNIKCNEKIPSFHLAKFLKSFSEEIIIPSTEPRIAIEYEKYTNQKNWVTSVSLSIKQKHYKIKDFINSARSQYILHQTLSLEAFKLIIMKNTPVKILSVKLDYHSPESERILNMVDFYEEDELVEERERYPIVDCYHLIKGLDMSIEDEFFKMMIWQNHMLREQ
jgi:hypothetical protein